jgi:hypothetical protein
VVLAALALGAGPAARPVAAQEAERGILELRIGRLAGRTVEAWRAGETALLPLTAFLSLAEFRWRAAGAAIEVTLYPGPATVLLAAGDTAIAVRGRTVLVPPGSLVAAEGELFASTALLEVVFGAPVAVDWGELVAAVTDPSRLPVGLRLRREAARASLATADPEEEPGAVDLAPPRDRIEGALADWAVSIPSGGSDPTGSLALGVGLGRSALEAVFRTEPTLAGRRVEADVTWTRVWRDHRWLTQLRLGDVPATGPRPRTVRGAAVSNAPYLRQSRVGSLPFAGDLGPGWLVEAYRQGQLIAFDSVDAFGRYAFEVPVQYGENPVEFIAYGPDGEIRPFDRMVRVAMDQLPGGTFEYGVSAGECRRLACRGSGNLDLRYGVSPRVTVSGGLEAAWGDSVAEATQPYVSAAATPVNSLGLEAEYLHSGFTRAAASFAPSQRVQVVAEAGWFDGGAAVSPTGGLREQYVLRGQWRPRGPAGRGYVDAELDRTTLATGTRTNARLGGSTYLHGLRLVPYVRMESGEATGTATFLGSDVFVLPRAALGGAIGRLWARARLELAPGEGARQAGLSLALPLGRYGASAESGIRWQARAGTALTFQLNATLPWARSATSARFGAAGGYAMQSLAGTAVWDQGAGRVRTAPGPSLQRAGLSGVVFLDADADGVRDGDEAGLSGARLIIGSRPAITDTAGGYAVWDLPAFESVTLRLDTLSLRDPLWVPAASAVRVEPGPDGYRRVEVALVPGAVVEGAVRWSARTGRVGGVPLLLLAEDSERVWRTATFRDGGFYLMGVPPGRYRLLVAPEALAALGAVAEPVPVTVTPAAAREGLAPFLVELMTGP